MNAKTSNFRGDEIKTNITAKNLVIDLDYDLTISSNVTTNEGLTFSGYNGGGAKNVTVASGSTVTVKGNLKNEDQNRTLTVNGSMTINGDVEVTDSKTLNIGVNDINSLHIGGAVKSDVKITVGKADAKGYATIGRLAGGEVDIVNVVTNDASKLTKISTMASGTVKLETGTKAEITSIAANNTTPKVEVGQNAILNVGTASANAGTNETSTATIEVKGTNATVNVTTGISATATGTGTAKVEIKTDGTQANTTVNAKKSEATATAATDTGSAETDINVNGANSKVDVETQTATGAKAEAETEVQGSGSTVNVGTSTGTTGEGNSTVTAGTGATGEVKNAGAGSDINGNIEITESVDDDADLDSDVTVSDTVASSVITSEMFFVYNQKSWEDAKTKMKARLSDADWNAFVGKNGLSGKVKSGEYSLPWVFVYIKPAEGVELATVKATEVKVANNAVDMYAGNTKQTNGLSWTKGDHNDVYFGIEMTKNESTDSNIWSLSPATAKKGDEYAITFEITYDTNKKMNTTVTGTYDGDYTGGKTALQVTGVTAKDYTSAVNNFAPTITKVALGEYNVTLNVKSLVDLLNDRTKYTFTAGTDGAPGTFAKVGNAGNDTVAALLTNMLGGASQTEHPSEESAVDFAHINLYFALPSGAGSKVDDIGFKVNGTGKENGEPYKFVDGNGSTSVTLNVDFAKVGADGTFTVQPVTKDVITVYNSSNALIGTINITINNQ